MAAAKCDEEAALLLLSIRSPCLAESGEVEARSNWSVMRVKEEISRKWSDHPRPEEQRLIHAGKLLENTSLLSDVLRLDEDVTHCTVYLVRRQEVASGDRSDKQLSSEGLRKRNNVQSHNQNQQQQQQPSEAAATTTDPWASYFQQYESNESSAAMHRAYYAHYMSHYMQLWNYHHPSMVPAALSGNAAAAASNYHRNHQAAAAIAPALPDRLEPVAAAAAAAAAVVRPPAANAPPRGAEQPVPPQIGGRAAAGAAANNGAAMMNAGAGAVGAMEEEDGEFDGGQRDVLDWIYVAMRVVMLFLLVYFHSSLARFALVVGFGLAVYMYRLGMFGGGRERVEARRGEGNVEGGDDNAGEGEDDGADSPTPSNDEDVAVAAQRGQQQQQQTTWPSVALTFVTTFFTSLMPNDPQVV